MHVSKHTFKFAIDGRHQLLVYNPLTDATDLVDRSAYRAAESLIKNGRESEICPNALQYMKQRGYLYNSESDEDAALRRGFVAFKEREKTANLRFVILPTYQCNARCRYCFIGSPIGEEALMTHDVLRDAFFAMDALAESRGQSCVKQLSLFGGEPLIYTAAQTAIVEHILTEGAQRGFLIDVVSNGLDLVHYVPMLKQYQVSKVQVTFDGLADNHNERRPAVDSKGRSFQRVAEGVDEALAHGVPINARILLDRKTIEQLPQLVGYFEEKRWFNNPNFTTHIGSVFDCFKCQPKEETVRHLTAREGNRCLARICNADRSIADKLSLDWQGVRRFLQTGTLFPPTYKTCFGGTKNFAFDLHGGIYACETTSGKEEYRVGTFSPAFSLKHEVIAALEERTIFTIPGCMECSQALLCAGGCAMNANVQHGSLFSKGCRLLKETVQYGLNYYWPDIEAAMGEGTTRPVHL